MNSVFVLQHESEDSAGGGDVKIIGVFSGKEKAESAIWRLKSEPGFSQSPKGFSIDEYRLDRIHWSEGYVTK